MGSMRSNQQETDPTLQFLLISNIDSIISSIKEWTEARPDREWVVCRSGKTGLQALRVSTFDAVVVGLTGENASRSVIQKARSNGISTPMILLAPQQDAASIAKWSGEKSFICLSMESLCDRNLTACLDRVVEHNHSVTKLIHSESCFRALFETSPQAMCLTDPRSERIIAMNQAAKALYWLPSNPRMGLSLKSLRAETKDTDGLPSPLFTGFRPSEHCELELHRRRDGALLYIELCSREIALDNDSIQLLIMTDVSERIAALGKARSSERAYLNLLDDMRDAVLVLGADHRPYYSNPAATAMLGPGLEDLESLKPYLNDARTGRSFEILLPAENGEKRWLDVLCTATKWQGQPRLLLTLRDISQRKQSDEMLHLLQRSIDVTSNGVFITRGEEQNYKVIYCNPAFQRITGYSWEETLETDSRTLLATDEDDPNRDRIRQSLNEQAELQIVLRNYRKDGTPFWNDFYFAPVPSDGGSVPHFVGIINDISEHKQAQSELAYNAGHDVLTGLPNRSLLEDRLEQALSLVERHNLALAVLLLNLDNFKLVNDALGLRLGDRLLEAIAQRLTKLVRPGDTVARLGGDEFAILLPDLAAPNDAAKIADKALAALSQPYTIDDQSLHITASMGIAVTEKRIKNAMDLVQQADMAMLEAKQSGKNSYQWYSAHLSMDADKRAALRNSLENAMAFEHLHLLYQPQINCQTGKFVGSEALIRWQDPQRGQLLPVEFIPVLEETGQIIQLGEWILNKACCDNQQLINAGHAEHTVSVNISPIQLQQANFPDIVDHALSMAGMAANRLALEITESVLLGDTEQVISNMESLRDRGVGIVIDDFGNGYSSLNYLKDLPATKLKIARHFIKDIIRDGKESAITKGIISLAHHLGLEVVVVGVESESQATFLKRNHCDVLQGQLYSHPVPLAELTTTLHAGPHPGEKPEEADRPTLLILDDEPNIIRALSRLLRRDGYRILATTDAEEAFRLLAENEVQVIISDQRMPEISGTEFLSQVKDIYPGTIRIVLSGYTDLKSVTDAINEGAIYKFLTKPWEDDQLRQNIREAFMHQTAGQANDLEQSHA